MIDLNDLEQLIELSQTKAIAEAIFYISKYFDGKKSLKEMIQGLMDDIEKNGLDSLNKRPTGYFSKFRGIDLAFAINPCRELKNI